MGYSWAASSAKGAAAGRTPTVTPFRSPACSGDRNNKQRESQNCRVPNPAPPSASAESGKVELYSSISKTIMRGCCVAF